MRGHASFEPIDPDTCMWDGVSDVINAAKFVENRSKDFGAGRPRNMAFPIDFAGRPYNTLTLVCERVIKMSQVSLEMHPLCVVLRLRQEFSFVFSDQSLIMSNMKACVFVCLRVHVCVTVCVRLCFRCGLCTCVPVLCEFVFILVCVCLCTVMFSLWSVCACVCVRFSLWSVRLCVCLSLRDYVHVCVRV